MRIQEFTCTVRRRYVHWNRMKQSDRIPYPLLLLFGDQATSDAVARVAGRIALQVVGFGVNH